MEIEKAKVQGEFWHSVREWAVTIVIAIIIAIPVRYFIAETFIVQGASMDPNFATGQFLIIDRLSYRFSEPQRGDVIVFKYPNNPKVYYIKRIIGLPHESISISDGKVTISSSTSTDSKILLEEPYIDAGHASHDTLEATLGDQEYFVMGDNRLQSSDSRTWGPVDRKLIVGEPIVRLFPFNTISILPGQKQ